jgi:hypothetical protein
LVDSPIDLPEDKGTYVQIVFVAQTKRLGMGRLGVFDILPGHYAYVGSARGLGGIRARVGHHLESAAAPHWHIDYLLGVATPVEVRFAIPDRKLEQDLREADWLPGTAQGWGGKNPGHVRVRRGGAPGDAGGPPPRMSGNAVM